VKSILLVLLLAIAAPTFACSCRFDDRTLEQRLDDAPRVVRVQVITAALVAESAVDAATFPSLRAERVVYRLRALEVIKGRDAALPRLRGLAGDGGGDCTERLTVGEDLLLFAGVDDRDLQFNFCSLPFARLGRSAERPLDLPAVRAYVRDRIRLHDCDNLPLGIVSPEALVACRTHWSETTRRQRQAAVRR
jgi:hypothetical protein